MVTETEDYLEELLKRSQQLFYNRLWSAIEAKEAFGIDIEGDWMLKLIPGETEEEMLYHLISPTGEEWTPEDIFIGEAGRWLTKPEYEAQQVDYEAALAEQAQLEQLFSTVLPQFDLDEALRYAELLPVSFSQHLQSLGRTTETETLLGLLGMTETEIGEFFGPGLGEVPKPAPSPFIVSPEAAVRIGLGYAVPRVPVETPPLLEQIKEPGVRELYDLLPETTEGDITPFWNELLRRGRTEQTENLLRVLDPTLTEAELQDIFAPPGAPTLEQVLTAPPSTRLVPFWPYGVPLEVPEGLLSDEEYKAIWGKAEWWKYRDEHPEDIRVQYPEKLTWEDTLQLVQQEVESWTPKAGYPPWWVMTLYSLPFFIMAPTAISLRAALLPWATRGGVRGVVAKTARGVLLPIAGLEVTLAAGLKYGVGVPLKYFAVDLPRRATRVAFEKALDAGLDKWLVRQGIREEQANVVVAYFMRRNHYWLYRQAQENLKKQMAIRHGRSAEEVARAAAEQTMKDAEPLLLQASREASMVRATEGMAPETTTALTRISEDVAKGKWQIPDVAALERVMAEVTKEPIKLTKTPSLMLQLRDKGYDLAAIEAMSAEEAWAALFKEMPVVPPPTEAVPEVEAWSAYSEGRIRADVVLSPEGTYRLLPRDPHFPAKTYKTEEGALKALANYGEVKPLLPTISPKPPVAPPVAAERIPKPVSGMPEAGIQKGMFGKDVIVQPVGKGKATQASLEAWGEVQKLIEGAEGSRGLLIRDIDKWIKDIQTELGNRSLPFHGGAISLFPGRTTKELEAMLGVYERAAEVAVTPTLPMGYAGIKATEVAPFLPTELTPLQIGQTLELFKFVLQSPGSEVQRAATLELRKHILAQRAARLQDRVEELIIEGKPVEEAVKLAETEVMSGKLPEVTSKVLDDITEEMRDILFARVYQVLKDEPFELMSTVEALSNALQGKSIPRQPGIKGGSAYSRLRRVFGDEPEILKAIDQEKPIRDVVNGIFRPVPTEPVPVDAVTAEYLRGLSTVPSGQARLGDKPWEFEKLEDLRTVAEKELADTESRLNVKLLRHEISKEQYEVELMVAREKVHPTIIPPKLPPNWPPTDVVFKEPSMIPPKQRALIVRALLETGASVVDIGNFMRANLASFDFSWWRQQAPLIVGNLGEFMTGNIRSWKAIWSQKAADASWERITRDPLYQLYEEGGYDFLRPLTLPPGTSRWKGVEEFGFLQSDRLIPRLTERIPWVKISQRIFVTGANEMNWAIYKNYYEAMLRVNERIAIGEIKLKAGEAFIVTEQMADIARLLSDFSGRAVVGEALGKLTPAANSLFFSLRLNMGRLLSPRHLVSANPRIRAFAWKNLLLFIGAIGGFLLAGERLGLWSIEWNPRSTNFAKIRIGNTRIDPWGGFEQFVVFFTRVINKSGLVSSTGMEYQVDPLGASTRFIRGKASPLAGVISDFWTGKNFLGDKVSVTDVGQWIERLAPFAMRDLWEAFAEHGPSGGLIGLPAIVGANVQTYSGDWRENWKKLGLPKYDDNVPFSIRDPKYTAADFWADTASEFTGVDPEELTAQKGFPPQIRAIAEAKQILEEISIIPNVKLISLNANIELGDTFVQFYQQWQERLKITDEGDLKEFDKRFPQAELGNFTQRQYAALTEYHSLPKSEQAAYLEGHPEIGENPRTEWLKAHSKENAQLAVWGQAKILTQEAYDEVQRLIKTLDIPDEAIPELTLPPKDSVADYFRYQELGEDLGWNSWETQLLLAKNDELREWLGREPIDTPIPALELKVKHRPLIDEFDGYGDKDSPFYIEDEDARQEARDKLKADNPEWVDDMRRVEASEKDAPDWVGEKYVKYGHMVDEFGAGSSEAKLFRIDQPDLQTWGQEALEWDDLADEKIPVLRINVKWAEQDDKYKGYGDPKSEYYISDDDKRAVARATLLEDNPDYAVARREREAYSLELPENLIPNYVTYYSFPRKGMEQELYLAENPEFKAVMAKILEWEAEEGKHIESLEISVKYQEDDEWYNGVGESKSEYYISDKDKRADARELYLNSHPKYARARYLRKAYDADVPDTLVDQYADYYMLPEKGHAQERFLKEYRDFYNTVWLGILKNEPVDFDKIMTEQFENFWNDVYEPATKGEERYELRGANRWFDEEGVTLGKFSKPYDPNKYRMGWMERMEEEGLLEEWLKRFD